MHLFLPRTSFIAHFSVLLLICFTLELLLNWRVRIESQTSVQVYMISMSLKIIQRQEAGWATKIFVYALHLSRHIPG
jgi:hypothetical protein